MANDKADANAFRLMNPTAKLSENKCTRRVAKDSYINARQDLSHGAGVSVQSPKSSPIYEI
jgi:hypothetical protein